MRCVDFPCCGHSPGDCPTIDSKGRERWRCVECGKRLAADSGSSICARCHRKIARRDESDLDHDFSMNY